MLISFASVACISQAVLCAMNLFAALSTNDAHELSTVQMRSLAKRAVYKHSTTFAFYFCWCNI
jgi:hypothetical protein